MPELKELFPDAPYIARPGQINAWDNEDFVKAIKATGKKQLIIAGVVTEVCVAAQIEKLRPASLAKAFRGELVPQDLGDEPAGELLARITKHNSVKTKIKSTKKSF
jgi:nicotinamidase-related amidase